VRLGRDRTHLLHLKPKTLTALSVGVDEAVATVRRQVSVGPEGGEVDDDLERCRP
jgi:hypothetical protein